MGRQSELFTLQVMVTSTQVCKVAGLLRHGSFFYFFKMLRSVSFYIHFFFFVIALTNKLLKIQINKAYFLFYFKISLMHMDG